MATAGNTYSDLEVANKSYSGLEVDKRHHAPAGLEYDHHRSDQYAQKKDVAFVAAQESEGNAVRNRQICGLSPKTFWIVLVLLVVIIIAGAVGGGVGGSFVSKAKSNEAIAASISSSSSSSTASQQQTSSSAAVVQQSSTAKDVLASKTTSSFPSKSTIITPEGTGVRDCPASHNTVLEVAVDSHNMQFRKMCGFSHRNAFGIDAVVGETMTSLDDCILECATHNVQNALEIAAGKMRACNAVCWRNLTVKQDDFPGFCFGYTTKNSTSNEFVTSRETRCDSAGWIDERLL